jgi:hypothetical protein
MQNVIQTFMWKINGNLKVVHECIVFFKAKTLKEKCQFAISICDYQTITIDIYN